MSRIVVTVALLLISGLANNAAADDGLKDPSEKKVKKINAYLDAVGINNPRIQEFTSTVSGRMEKGYLRIAEDHYDHGRIVLHYKAEPRISTRQLELKYQPISSPNTQFVATTRSAMMQYKLNF